MVHRDVKPSNLMVTPEGVVKLLDLGLARFEFERAVDEELTGAGVAVGTVDYMAPEQVTDSRSADIRADIYSLGCTLYKVLAGRTPFGGPEHRSVIERLKAHAREPVPPINQFRGDVPPEVVQTLRRMLEKDPNKRFQTPAEVADAMGPIAATGDLAALVAEARKVGQAFLPVKGVGQASLPVAPQQGQQAEIATGESRSPSSVTRFLRQIVGLPAAGSVARTRAAVVKWRKNIPVLISLGALGVLCVVALLIWAFSRGGDRSAESGRAAAGRGSAVSPAKPRQTCLVLQWPSDDRGSAILEINGQLQDLAALALTSSAAEIRIPLKPGEHKVSVRRLGYEAFERSFTLTGDKDTLLRPTWKELSSVAQPPSAVASEPKKETPVTEPKKEVVKEPEPVVVKPEPPKPKPPEEDPVLKRRRELAARWTEAMGPAEAMVASWDFAGADKAVEEVRFEEPELAARLASRREELPRMAAFKTRVIDKIHEKVKSADPPLKKFDLGLQGRNGDVTGASDEGIAARLSTGERELHPWSQLRETALPKVLHLAVEKDRPDDWLTAGMVSLALANPGHAEKCFEQARSLGANIDGYLAPLAEAALTRAEQLLEDKKYQQADAALADLESKYRQLPWFASNKPAIAAARDAAKRGIHETEAEKLYAEAVELLNQKELFDLKPLVEKLKSEYANTAPVTDGAAQTLLCRIRQRRRQRWQSHHGAP